nr:ATP-binding protein [Jiangella mangrovi]
MTASHAGTQGSILGCVEAPTMQRRTATVAAAVITAVTVVAVASLWVRGRSADVVYGLYVFHNAPAALTLSWVGRLVVLRRADNAIGPVLLVISGLGAAHVAVAAMADVAMVSWGYDAPITEDHPLIPAEMPLTASVPLWIMNWLWLPQVVLLLTVLPVLFPDGRLPGPRWRAVLWLAAIGGAVFLIGLIIDGWPTSTWSVSETPAVVEVLLAAGLLVLLAATAGSLAGLAVHWRRAGTGDRRPFQVVGTTVAVLAVLWIATYPWPWLWIPTVLIALQVLLIAYALAAARFRVHDLEPVLARSTVAAGLSVVMTIGFAAVTITAGLLAARLTDNDVLPLVAVGVVALSVEPVRRAARRLIDRIVFRLAADRMEVVSQVAAHAGSGAYDDLLAGVVDALRRGTGARRVEAWLHGDRGFEPAAATGPDGAHTTALTEQVTSHGEHFGELRLLVDVPGDLAPDARELLADVAHVAGAALHNARLTATLEAQLDELRSSRRRLVEAQDSARRSVERDLHDGAQAQLVALRLRLALIQSRVADQAGSASADTPDALAADLAEVAEGIDAAVGTLRDLARGLQPPILDQDGVAAALRAYVRNLPIPVAVSADGTGRYDAAIESAVYFACLEAIQNAFAHSGASRIEVRLVDEEDALTFSVVDDGKGFRPDRVDARRSSSGLVNIADRLDAVGGSLTIDSTQGIGTRVSGTVDITTT